MYIGSGLGVGGSFKVQVLITTCSVKPEFFIYPVAVTDVVSPYLLNRLKQSITLPSQVNIAGHEAYLLEVDFLNIPLTLGYNQEEYSRRGS